MVSHTELDNMGFVGLVDKYGGILGLLKKYFPAHEWDFSRVQRARSSKGQLGLFKNLQGVFGNDVEIFVNHPLDFQGSKLTLDFFIPSLKLAFEYQGNSIHHCFIYNKGEQHYRNVFKFGSTEIQQQRDQDKREICRQIGVTLIGVFKRLLFANL